MESEKADILSHQSNVAVVKLPSREYPGSVVQGDSLLILHSEIMEVLAELSKTPEKDAFYAAFMAAEKLEDRLMHYIAVCKAHGIENNFKIEHSYKRYEHLVENDL
ncbi:DUF6959 family protein [Arenicella xantha]|uniref:Uncharacterized protein n=1 Tax=Arenicella xantha TaxID=644221 RepID=A0A395JEG0_9GAMM|nr:hypothetical protein [Arenicella xantha]RBP46603.1 hypothetical protein DFR28_1171 [Arenicella xantha]